MVKKLIRNKAVIAGVGVLAVGLSAYALSVRAHRPKNGSGSTPSSTSVPADTSTSGAGSAGVGSGSGGTSSTTPATSGGSNAPATNTPTSTMAQPTGQILNKNTISLSSTDPQTSPDLESTCQTVPGATCDIKLTGSDGTVKTVGAKTVDENGYAIFEWNAKTLGLTTGTWKVQAVAAKGSQSSASASYNLTVNP